MKNSARIAEFIFRDESEGRFAFGDVAVAAASDGVGIVRGESLLLLSGIEAEDALFVGLQCLLAAGHGLVMGRFGVFGLAYLDGGAAAVPSVRRIVGGPEGVGGRECDAGEGRMLGADMVVSCGAVLEVVSVSVAGDLLPFGGHGGGGVSEVVLGEEVVSVVGRIDLSNVVIKAFEGLTKPVLIEERGEGLMELMEGLDGGEEIIGALEAAAHIGGHLDALEGAVEDIGMGRDEVLRFAGGEDIDVEDSTLLPEERGHEAAEGSGEALV